MGDLDLKNTYTNILFCKIDIDIIGEEDINFHWRTWERYVHHPNAYVIDV
jgi:hypothetical protein